MLSTLLGYLTEEVLPRWRAILLTSETFLACVGGLLIAICDPFVLDAKPTVNEFVTAVAAYAAIAMGFCVAGMTIALTLPSETLLKKLAEKEIKAIHGNALSGLLFVFSWTALIHWTVVLLMMVGLLVGGADAPLLPLNADSVRRGTVGFACGLVLYCLFQFLITIIAISQAGTVYINALREQTPQSGGDEQPRE